MLRQRIRARTPGREIVGRALTVLLALVLIWGGVVFALLALKSGRGTVNAVTGYRAVFDFFAGLGPGDVDGGARVVLAVAGVAAALLFGFLAWRALPRPYLARRALDLEQGDRGGIVVAPRAIERIAETAALGQDDVTGARGRYEGDDVAVAVSLARTTRPAEILREVRASVRTAMDDHGLPPARVDVTLAGYQPNTTRELDQ